MKKYIPCIVPKIKVTKNASEISLEDTHVYYQWLANRWMGKSYTSKPNVFYISWDEMSANIEVINNQLLACLEELEEAKNVETDIVLIDLRDDLLPKRLILPLGNTIKSYLQKKSDSSLHFLVLLSDFADNDTFIKALKSSSENGRVRFVSDKGKYIPSNAQTNVYVHIQHSGYLDSLHNKIKRSMICRLGHFKEKKRQEDKYTDEYIYCHRYFYDGSACVNEIAEKLSISIGKICRDKGFSSIALASCPPVSDWFKQVTSSVEKYISTISCDWTGEVKPNMDIPPVNSIFLMTAMTDNGKTILDAYKKIRNIHQNTPIFLYTVLTSENENIQQIPNERLMKRTLLLDEESVEVTCLLQVEVPASTLYPSNCPMCDVMLPETSKLHEDSYNLTAYDYWELSSEAGFIDKERDPDLGNREPLEKVPDFPKMIEKHGPWFASLIKNILKKHYMYVRKIVFVSPKQYFPKMFAPLLKLHLLAEVILIPDDVVLGKQSPDENDYWYQQLQSLNLQETKIVLFDEFSVSGKKAQKLYDLVTKVTKTPPVCYICLVDYHPEHTRVGNNSNPIPTYSLYDFAYEPS